MIEPIECYNKINGCLNTVPDDAEHVAFCSPECWRQYNDIKEGDPAERKKYDTVGSIIARCKERATEGYAKRAAVVQESLKIFDGGL